LKGKLTATNIFLPSAFGLQSIYLSIYDINRSEPSDWKVQIDFNCSDQYLG